LITARFLEKHMNHDPSQHDSEPKGFWSSRYAIGLLVLGAIAAYFLLSEHRPHFFSALPSLLLLACPLMHVFTHRGHGGHGRGHADHHCGEQGSTASAAPQAP
jgi:DUF2933 family protein